MPSGGIKCELNEFQIEHYLTNDLKVTFQNSSLVWLLAAISINDIDFKGEPFFFLELNLRMSLFLNPSTSPPFKFLTFLWNSGDFKSTIGSVESGVPLSFMRVFDFLDILPPFHILDPFEEIDDGVKVDDLRLPLVAGGDVRMTCFWLALSSCNC